MNNKLLSFGHGYSAQALADILLPLGWKIRATTRSKEKFNKIKKPGILVRLWSDQSLSDDLDWATHLLISIAPDKYEDLVLKEFREKIIKNIKQFKWVGYLSTTGVYGNHDGGWIGKLYILNNLNHSFSAYTLYLPLSVLGINFSSSSTQPPSWFP